MLTQLILTRATDSESLDIATEDHDLLAATGTARL